MVFFVYFFIFLTFMDFFSQLPIMSTYAQSFGANTMLIGFIVGAYSFSNMFSNVISGHFVDRFGPKNVLTLGFIFNGLILFLYSVVFSGEQLLSVRLIHGMSAGFLVPAAFTYVSIMNRGNKSGKRMALSGAAVGIAAIIGPAFGGVITKFFGAGWVFRSIGVVMIASGFLTAFLPDNRKKSGQKADVLYSEMIHDYFLLFKNRGLLIAYLGAFSLMFSQGILAYMLPLKVSGLNLESHVSGLLMSTFGIVAILLFLLPTNKMFDRFKNEYIMIGGMLIISFSLILLSFVSKQTALFVFMGIYGAGFALLFPSISSLISLYSAREKRGKAFGLFYGFFSLGSFSGSSLTGAFSMTSSEAFLTAATLLIGVSFFVTTLLLFNRGSSAE